MEGKNDSFEMYGEKLTYMVKIENKKILFRHFRLTKFN